jgi:hypothetical protein
VLQAQLRQILDDSAAFASRSAAAVSAAAPPTQRMSVSPSPKKATSTSMPSASHSAPSTSSVPMVGCARVCVSLFCTVFCSVFQLLTLTFLLLSHSHTYRCNSRCRP